MRRAYLSAATARCRGDSQPLAFTRCVIITCLVSMPSVAAECQGVDISVSLYPQGMINLLHGEPLDILCVSDAGSANELTFMIAGKHVESEIVNSTTRKLHVENLKKGAYLINCKNNHSNKHCTTRVLVESPPSEVSDFECISLNLDKLTCSWSTPATYAMINYTLSIITNKEIGPPCIPERENRKISCSWTTSSIPRYRQMVDYYNFVLKSCNAFGCIQQMFTVNHFAIVKPNPPESVKVLNTGPHSAQLQWNISTNMVDFLPCPLVHRIEYQIAKIDNTTYFHTVDTLHLSPNKKTYTFTLTNLPYAHMIYEVRISIKSALATDDRFWSDFNYVMFTTDGEVPQRPPKTVAGAFVQGLFENNRNIIAYWEQLEEYEYAGENFTYEIVVPLSSNRSQTQHNNKNYVELNNVSDTAIDISIRSKNAIGSSVEESHVYIPAQPDTEFFAVDSFTKVEYDNGRYKLSWISKEIPDNYTLFWCEHSVTRICTGRLFFTTLQPNVNTYDIVLSRDKKYQFAISANKGSKSTGMIWPSCDVSSDAIPFYEPVMKLHHNVPQATSVKITWWSDCTLTDVIKGYVLKFCRVDNSGDGEQCSGDLRTQHVDDPRATEALATGLAPATTYRFALAVNTTYGLKAIKNASALVTTASA